MADSLVLVIGDDPGFRGLICTLLEESLGVRTVVASDAKEAVERVRAARPALVVLDVMVSPAQGLAVMQALKVKLAGVAIPLITLVPWKEASVEGICAACDACVPKPLDIDTFLATARLLLPKEAEGESPQAPLARAKQSRSTRRYRRALLPR